jgi:predicted lipoprotein with Yx(FWY)xxD motif
MRGLGLVLLSAVIGGWLAGCGASSPTSHTGAVTTASTPRSQTSAATTAGSGPTDPVKAAAARPRFVRVARTAYGVALVDRRGFALYRFTRDTRAASTCYGACASAWPPDLAPRSLALGSVNGGLVGTTRRADGRLQVTYAGHPLYYHVGDRRPGQVLCQGVTEYGGGWYVVAPSGHLIR